MSRVCRGVSLCTLATWAALFLNCRRKLYAALVLFFLICISFVEFTKLSAAHQVNFQVLIYFGSEGRPIALCSYRAIVFPGRSRFILILFFFVVIFLSYMSCFLPHMYSFRLFFLPDFLVPARILSVISVCFVSFCSLPLFFLCSSRDVLGSWSSLP